MKYTVYIIRHISTWQVLYVGKTRNFKRRAYEHLKLNTNSKVWLSSIGTDNVLIEAVDEFDNEVDALKYEDKLILKYDTITNGYNKHRSGLIKVENTEGYNREWFQIRRKGNKEWNKKHNVHQKKYLQRLKENNKIDKIKEYHKEYMRYYNKAKKIGISFADYRKLKEKDQAIQLTINFS